MRSPADADGGYSLRIARSMAGLELLGGWVDAVAAALHLEPSTEYALRLCLEEATANVVMHGTPGGDADFVMLRVDPKADLLCVTVEDRCGAFDPLEVPPPERPTSLEDARIGGLGIHLMRQYARSMSYERVGSVNRLRLSLSLSPGAESDKPPVDG